VFDFSVKGKEEQLSHHRTGQAAGRSWPGEHSSEMPFTIQYLFKEREKKLVRKKRRQE
jgi:hypothetical protein